MQRVSEISALPRIGKAAGRVAAAVVFSAVLCHAGLADAGPHGGGGGFHGGGFGFYAPYGYGYPYGYIPYYGDAGVCYEERQRVKTRYGWRLRRTSICE